MFYDPNLLRISFFFADRRSVQTMLIDSAVVEWLFSVLEDPDELSDYSIEYAVALLMNLCLRTSGKFIYFHRDATGFSNSCKFVLLQGCHWFFEFL